MGGSPKREWDVSAGGWHGRAGVGSNGQMSGPHGNGTIRVSGNLPKREGAARKWDSPAGAFIASGQTCVSAKRILVQVLSADPFALKPEPFPAQSESIPA